MGLTNATVRSRHRYPSAMTLEKGDSDMPNPQPGQSSAPHLSNGYTEGLDGRLINTSTGRPCGDYGGTLKVGKDGKLHY